MLGYDARARPGGEDGCAVLWRRGLVRVGRLRGEARVGVCR